MVRRPRSGCFRLAGNMGVGPSSGEIDIMEHISFKLDMVHASVMRSRTTTTSTRTRPPRCECLTRAADSTSTRSSGTRRKSARTSTSNTYFTFKNERLTNPAADFKEWPFDKPFHLLLNIAVGGTWGGSKGVDEKIWPQRMEIDYVRVYQSQKGSGNTIN